mgnify:FL=1
MTLEAIRVRVKLVGNDPLYKAQEDRAHLLTLVDDLKEKLGRAEYAVQRAVTLRVANAEWFQDEADAIPGRAL